jgi:hypothetical protein
MPKIAKGRKGSKKVEPFDTVMSENIANQDIDNHAAEETDAVAGESNHAIFKRHAGEWKRMKAQVAIIKSQRKSLSKKQRDKKKKLSQDIKLLLSSLQSRHDEELRTLGIIPPKRSDMMLDDEDE